VSSYRRAGLDSRSLAGVAIFGALAVVLTTISQALGLNFPVVPYLQFDFGEIAIILAFFIFGPLPALIAGFIEFATLMAIGQNVAFYGPELKLIAIVSSLLGIWLGAVAIRRTRHPTVKKAAGLGAVLGMTIRAIALTLPNYLLIVYLYTLSGILGYVSGSFKLIGVTLTDSNALVLILAMTAVFNALQFGFVSIVSYGIVSLPQIRSMRVAGRKLWIATYLEKRESPVTLPPQEARAEVGRSGRGTP
jgi:riboflavin transporter FmnP